MKIILEIIFWKFGLKVEGWKHGLVGKEGSGGKVVMGGRGGIVWENDMDWIIPSLLSFI